MAPRRGKAGPEGRRSEIVSVRLDPRLKYLAELAARKQRRPLSGLIEWAVERALSDVIIRDDPNPSDSLSVADAESLRHLWDVDEADRLVRLGLYYPDLLTYDEQLIWKQVRELGYIWRGTFSGPEGTWKWTVDEQHLCWDRLRAHWSTIKKVASGELPASELPKWTQKSPRPPVPTAPTTKRGPLDDDIPF